ncbi:hypothetical protein [Roseibium alexandrii]|uniref:hypothetical protein n=1 Tax=Roseibium alexandrii TaxID=388408 RepID=UPI00375050ED
MGKRSNFKRRKNDDYPTPYKGVLPLIPFLKDVQTFAEPCAGGGALIRHLEMFGFECGFHNELTTGIDARLVNDFGDVDTIITNPPWTREILHALISHFSAHKPTWLLFDSDWAFTYQAEPYLSYCTDIVAVGRLKWIEDSPYSGKDNCAWYRFDKHPTVRTRFHGLDRNTNKLEAIYE